MCLTCCEVIKAGPSIRVPQKRFRRENNQLQNKKYIKFDSSYNKVVGSRLILSSVSGLCGRENYRDKIAVICCHHIALQDNIRENKHFLNSRKIEILHC